MMAVVFGDEKMPNPRPTRARIMKIAGMVVVAVTNDAISSAAVQIAMPMVAI